LITIHLPADAAFDADKEIDAVIARVKSRSA